MSAPATTQRGGPGRPSRYPNEPMECKTIRLTKKQRDKLDKLGGGEWVRTKINAAPEPA